MFILENNKFVGPVNAETDTAAPLLTCTEHLTLPDIVLKYLGTWVLLREAK